MFAKTCYKWVWWIDWIKYVTTKCNNYIRSYNFIDIPSLPKALCIFLGTGPIDQRFHWENNHWDSFQTLIDAYVIVSIYSDIMLWCLTVWYNVMFFHMPHSDIFPCHTLFCARVLLQNMPLTSVDAYFHVSHICLCLQYVSKWHQWWISRLPSDLQHEYGIPIK